jgi:putative transposase
MCTRCRGKVLYGDVDEALQSLVEDVFHNVGYPLIEQETDKDHWHIVFGIRPQDGPLSRFINSLKSVRSRRLRQQFPQLKDKVKTDAFWSRSYFRASIGEVSLDDVKHYVQTQKDR